MPKRLRYFLQCDADLQGAVPFIRRFSFNLYARLHFHCVIIDGMFDAAAAGGLSFVPRR